MNLYVMLVNLANTFVFLSMSPPLALLVPLSSSTATSGHPLYLVFSVTSITSSFSMITVTTCGRFLYISSLMFSPPSNTSSLSCPLVFTPLSNPYNVTMVANSTTLLHAFFLFLLVLRFVCFAHTPLRKTAKLNVSFALLIISSARFSSKRVCH